MDCKTITLELSKEETWVLHAFLDKQLGFLRKQIEEGRMRFDLLSAIFIDNDQLIEVVEDIMDHIRSRMSGYTLPKLEVDPPLKVDKPLNDGGEKHDKDKKNKKNQLPYKIQL